MGWLSVGNGLWSVLYGCPCHSPRAAPFYVEFVTAVDFIRLSRGVFEQVITFYSSAVYTMTSSFVLALMQLFAYVVKMGFMLTSIEGMRGIVGDGRVGARRH